MLTNTVNAQLRRDDLPLDLLRCPLTNGTLSVEAEFLQSATGHRYPMTASGIPLFAQQFASNDARMQQAHYEKIAAAYVENLSYPHTQEYAAYLDRMLIDAVGPGDLGQVAEICCGHGEACRLFDGRIGRGIGVDVSLAMLEEAQRQTLRSSITFAQGDAIQLPLASNVFDAVFMLGGIHHVNDREKLFSEVARILRPGGRFWFREPADDFWVWRAIRKIVYRLSPALDHEHEHPLRRNQTIQSLERAGLYPRLWSTHGFFGFCIFMNSDVLVFNRLFRFLPGIRPLTRACASIDKLLLNLPGLRNAGLQVIGLAEKL